MESEHDFIDVFVKLWRTNQPTELRRLFGEGGKYLREQSDEHIGIFLEKLFDKDDGLHKFIRTTLLKTNMSKPEDLAVRGAFNFLCHLVKNYPEHLKRYLSDIFEVCSHAMGLRIIQLTIQAAYTTLIAFMEMFPDYNEGYNDFIETFIKKHKYYRPEELLYMIHISSMIARQHPNLDAIITHGIKIERLATQDLIAAYSKAVSDGKLQRLNIRIDSLTNILFHFSIENPSRENEIYKRMKGILDNAGQDFEKNIHTIEYLIKFMTQHMSKFERTLRQDSKAWHLFFCKASLNETLTQMAIDALRVYYDVLGNGLKALDADVAHPILEDLMKNFETNIPKEYTNPKMMRCDIIGCSKLAECTKIILGEEPLENLYSLISRRVFPLYISDDNIQTNFDDLIDYQEALARILVQLSGVNMHRIRMQIKMCTTIIKRFPELSPSSQQYAIDSLQRTIRDMKQLKVYDFDEFLSTVIRDGIIWSCSHALLIDVEIENSRKRPISYKNYVRLWRSLLKNDNHGLDSQDKIATELLNTCISLVSTLDLRIKSREENVFSDIAVSQVASNDTDFRIFVNLVDLYHEILSNIAEECSSEDLKKVLYTLIELSNKNPLISGFYRLVSRILNVMKDFQAPETELVVRYLMKTSKLVFEFAHELQISCIQLILHVPKVFVSSLIPHVAPVFQLAFKLGLNNYEFANETLDNLQRFFYWSDNDSVKSLLREVSPSLEIYIRSKESLEIYEDPDNPEKQVKKAGSNLEELQNRILLFMGQIDNTTMLQFLYKQSQNTGGSWDEKNLLEYTMTFPDMYLAVPLDTILPRIIELSLNCSDRRTRISACEALHSSVVLILGNTVVYISADPDRYARLYKVICPVLLKLGCDNDDVIRQIFNPFMLQMTHWVSSRLMRNSPVVEFLIETFFDGLCDDHNASIKDFSGICLREFVNWSIKQASDRDLRTAPVNIDTVVQNIKSFALHPLKNRKIAAAIAFNHIYKILREREEIVNIFWLEFLYCFVESMDGCSDPRIRDALDHVARVLLEKPAVFVRNSSSRKIPKGFDDGTLRSCVDYLFTNCMCFDECARKKSMELYERLFAKLSENLRKNVNEPLIQQLACLHLQCQILERLQEAANLKEKTKNIITAMDVYTWFLQKKLIDPKVLFSKFFDEQPSIFTDVQKFISEINESPNENCTVILKIMDFAIEILQITITGKEKIHDFLFDEQFFILMSFMIVQPQRLGFDGNNNEIKTLLPVKIKELVQAMIGFLPSRQIDELCETIEGNIDDISKMFDIKDPEFMLIVPNEVKIKSLILLKNCDLLKRLRLNNIIASETPGIIEYIFQKLKNYDTGTNWCADLPKPMISYFTSLLELLWDKDSLLILLTEKSDEVNELLSGVDASQITHGEYFFIIFRDVLIQSLTNEIESTLEIFANVLDTNVDYSLFILNDIAMWLQKHKKEHEKTCEKFANGVIDMFKPVKRSINDIEKRKLTVRNIYRTAFRLMAPMINLKSRNIDLYEWILEQIYNNPAIAGQTQILNDFLIGLADISDGDIEMKLILNQFSRLPELGGLDGNVKSTMESLEIVELYQTLFSALPITKSFLVLEAVVNVGKKIGKFAISTSANDHLLAFFNSITEEKATEALEKIYQSFMTSTDAASRLNILRNFLCPAFEWCSKSTVNSFFERNMKEIIVTITRKPPFDQHDKLKLEISKIGAYNLLQIMFSTLDLEKINDTSGPIATRVIEETKVNVEVLLQLYKNTVEARKSKLDENNKEISRLMHGAAYNCAITITTVCKEEKYLKGLFGEDPTKDQLIWKKILDCSKNYTLSQTFKELPKQKKVLVNIQQTLKDRQPVSPNYSYVKSYNLASSTLTEDIFSYDMNGVVPLQEPVSSKLSVTLEADDLNDHECMAQICGVIQYIFEVHVKDSRELPAFFKPLIGALSTDDYNVQLFLIKVIINCQENFKQFAGAFLRRIILVLNSFLQKTPMNYIIADALLMLIDWAEVVTPGENIRDDVNRLLSLLVLRVDPIPSLTPISRYNFNIIQMLVKVWHPVMDIPICLADKIKKNPNAGVILIHIFLSQGLGEKMSNDLAALDFLSEFIKNWKTGEECLVKAFAAIGLYLKFMEPRDSELRQQNHRIALTRDSLIRITDPDRRIKCIYAMCTAFPALLNQFYEPASLIYKTVTNLARVKILDMFLTRINSLSNDEIHSQIRHFNIKELLQNKVLPCEKICLQIIHKLVEKLQPDVLLPLAQSAVNYSQHVNKEYRELVYNIFIAIFDKYLNDESVEGNGDDLIELGQNILLSGLLDSSNCLKEKLMNFWNRANKFGNTCYERILNILSDYSPEISQDFLPILGVLFLHFSKESPHYEAELFKPLDKDCNYKNYKIATALRLRNLSYRVPMFVSSYASQCNQQFTLSSLASDDFAATHDTFMLRATNPMEFEPTFADTSLADRTIGLPNDEDDDAVFAVPAAPKAKLSKRFVNKGWRENTNQYRNELQIRKKRDAYMEEKSIKQRSSIKLNRSYRIGDLPDIAITHQAVLNPIQDLMKKDQVICKYFIVSIISSLIKKLQNCKRDRNRDFSSIFMKKLSERFEEIFNNYRGCAPIVSAALEIIWNNSELAYKPEIVAHVCHLTGLNALGALLIERKLMNNEEEAPAKKRRVENQSDDIEDKWIYLGELYESINDTDVFLSVFSNHVPVKDLNDASSARAENNWQKAKSLYETARAEKTGPIFQHCQRGIFECLAQLSDWEEITNQIRNDFGADKTVSHFLQKTQSLEEGWVTPWYFKSHTHLHFMGHNERTFREQLQLAMNNAQEKAIAEDLYVEELAALCPAFMNEHSKFLVTSALRKMKDQWSQLSSLSVQLRFQKMIQLRGLCDIKIFREAATNVNENINQLLDYWERSSPSENDDLVSWDIHIARRLSFSNVLVVKLQSSNNENSQLQAVTIKQQFAFMNSAYHQKNPVSMSAQMVHFIETEDQKTPAASFRNQLKLNKTRLKFLQAQIAEDSEQIRLLQKSREKSFELEKNINVPSDIAIQNMHFAVDWSLAMFDFKEKNENQFNEIIDRLIGSSVFGDPDDVEDRVKKLERDAINKLKKSIEIAPLQLSCECHMKAIKYCHSRIMRGKENAENIEMFVESTLKAMNLGSNEASSYFPCILREHYLNNNVIRDIFMRLTARTPSWKFLNWQPQLFRHLSTGLHNVVAPIIKRLAEDYPDALLYTLQATIVTIPQMRYDETILKLVNKFADRTDFYDFVEAMEYLVRPELYLKHHLDDLLKSIEILKVDTDLAVDNLMKKVYDLKNPLMQGNLYVRYIGNFRAEILRIKDIPSQEIAHHVESLKRRLDESIRTHKDSNKLEDYSPYLSQINGSEIEIPGLCTGDSCPEYLPKIMKIESKVQVMKSNRRPIKITIIGDDTKSYDFLVKFGEDLRLDQRLQQTFNLVNEILEADLSCSQRNLSVNTYKVIPFSGTLGLIEWINNTKTFQDFIEFSMNDRQKKNLHEADREYENWINQSSSTDTKRSIKYKDSVLHHSAEETINKMNSLIAKVDTEALRRSCITINPSAESFMSFRKNFITSYAVLCTVQWILGIGDRHLENTLIQVESGKCTGIDFASAFGGGIDQAIPELMPFRLTSQILKLMEPFDEKDLFGVTMIHVLKALKKNRGLIAELLAVIVQENLNWAQYANKFTQDTQGELSDVTFVPNKKIRTMTRKLNGGNPSDLMIEELKHQHNNSIYRSKYVAIVSGGDSNHETRRFKFRGKSLTPEEQVECLLDQATDLNVLGRTYVGWRPWL